MADHAQTAGTHTAATQVAAPVTEEAFLADRQRFWGSFTRFTLYAVIAVIIVVVGLAIITL
ncbi:MAG: hypothetical protein JO264_01045 [Acidisphaera sp.]|nr:hypothetical protein [Acidisphaera sp.]